MSQIPQKVRDAVLMRANGICERCGAWSNLELHHRQYRSRGGQHTTANLVALCGWGNHTGCHGWAHTEGIKATAAGYQIASGNDPADVPILLANDVWARLDAKVTPINKYDAVEYMHVVGAIKEAS
jgi:hypothetical protein